MLTANEERGTKGETRRGDLSLGVTIKPTNL